MAFCLLVLFLLALGGRSVNQHGDGLVVAACSWRHAPTNPYHCVGFATTLGLILTSGGTWSLAVLLTVLSPIALVCCLPAIPLGGCATMGFFARFYLPVLLLRLLVPLGSV